jgi:hypothetical protein
MKGARFRIKSIKNKWAALPIIILGGLPIRVAVPPILAANISDNITGTGDISKFSQIAKVIGIINITVVTLSRTEEKMPVIILKKNNWKFFLIIFLFMFLAT